MSFGTYDANSLKSPVEADYSADKDFTARGYGYSDANSFNKSPSGSIDHDTSKESHVIDGVVDPDYDRTMNTMAEAALTIRRSTALNTFFLIIADILGPTSIPYSISTLGWAPGVVVGIVLGFTAIYGGFLLWQLYLHYDSNSRPIRTYGELVYRIFERYGHGRAQGAKLFVAFLQVLELLLAVASTILGNASGLSQIVVGSPSGIVTCFLYYSMAITILGMLISQIKMLHSVSRYAFVNFFLLMFLIGMVLGVAATSGVLDGTVEAPPGGVYGFGVVTPGSPVSTPAVPPYSFQIAVNGSLNLCYAFAGSLMFIEMMAEMRDARGFFRAALTAQLIIAVIYMAFGLALYGLQGQYIANPAQQGLAPYGWQTAGNAIYITTAVISCSVYANVGIRVVYICFLEEQFKIAPDMNTPKGTVIWGIVAFSFWALAFLMCEAIPQFSSLTGISAAVTVMPFTYTFPFLMSLMYLFQQDRTWKEAMTTNMLVQSVTGGGEGLEGA